MDKFSDQKRAVQYLYPPIDPFDQRMLDVGDGHQVYVEQSGNPSGIPVEVDPKTIYLWNIFPKS